MVEGRKFSRRVLSVTSLTTGVIQLSFLIELMQNCDQPKFGTTPHTTSHFNGTAAFNNMRLEFERAAAKYAAEVHESFYTFGGQNVRFRIVGDELAEHITRPFSHLRVNDQSRATTRLTIELWDENRTGISSGFDLPGNKRKWYETTVKSSDGRFIGQRLPYTVSCLDRQHRHILASIGWGDRISNYERAKPFARLLLEWHNDQDIQMIHAALVARHDRGALVVGKRGAGKSTFALACISEGLDYVSEDFVGLECRSDNSFVGHGLYNSVFLETKSLARFGAIIPYGIESKFSLEEKSVVILSQVFPERLKPAVPIKFLALLRVVDAVQPKLRSASKGEALLALGPSSLLQIPNRQLGPGGFVKLAQLVERVPCYWLEIGTELRSIAPSVESLLEELGSEYGLKHLPGKLRSTV